MFPARRFAVIGDVIATVFVVASGAVVPFAEYTVVYAGEGRSEPVDVQVITLVTAVPGVPFELSGVAVIVVDPATALVTTNVEVPAPTLLVTT
jgi:hypothetical protein